MKHALVVENRKHAAALMHWSKLDPGIWDVVPFGAAITTVYATALIARPIATITDDHVAWMRAVLKPRVVGVMRTFGNWQPGIGQPILTDPTPDPMENTIAAWT